MGKRGGFLCRYVSGPSSRFPSLSRRGTIEIAGFRLFPSLSRRGTMEIEGFGLFPSCRC